MSDVERCSHKNISFGKGRYYIDDTRDDGSLKKVPIISADCLRHALYEDEMSIFMVNVAHDDALMLEVLAQPVMIQRGYLFADYKKCPLKRRSPLSISYAKAIEHAVPALETFGNSQPKVAAKEDKGETSFFKREVQGQVKYKVQGAIDIGQLGFISVSDVHDRLAVHPDQIDQYLEKLQQNLDQPLKVSYFQKEKDIFQIPERGICLPDKAVRSLTKDILRRLATLNIQRASTGSVHSTKLDIQLISDPLVTADSITIYDGERLDLSTLDEIELYSPYQDIGDTLEGIAFERLNKYRKKVLDQEQEKEKKKKKKKNAKGGADNN